MKPFHLLISDEGVTLPIWQRVFKDGRVSALTNELSQDAIELVWFKLSLHQPISSQLDWITKNYGHHKIVILTNIPRFDEAMLCLGAGVRGYVNTHAGPNTLQQIADVVLEGGIWLGADLMQALISRVQKTDKENQAEALQEATDEAWAGKLTKRELDVAKLIAEGASNKLVARELDISERTVKAHVTAIFTKLGVSDRLKLALLLTSHKID